MIEKFFYKSFTRMWVAVAAVGKGVNINIILQTIFVSSTQKSF